MRTSNGLPVRLNGVSVRTTSNARNASKQQPTVTPAQAGFIRFLNENQNELPNFSNALKLAHDLMLYHTDVPLDNEEKFALYNIKCLWEEIDRLVEAE